MRFTIVTPSYKQIDWLRLCVASVRDQLPPQRETAKNPGPDGEPPQTEVEHIIQDAGSPGIEDFAREAGADFYRDGVLVFPGAPAAGLPPASTAYRIAIHCEADRGMYDAVNKGFRKASGDVFAYLNCDEQYLPGTLSRVAGTFASSPRAEVLFFDAIVVDSLGRYLCDRRVMVPTRLHTMVSGNLSVFTSSTFSKRHVFRERGFFFSDTLKDVGDAEWALRLAEANVQMQAVRFIASAFTDTGDNMNIRPNALAEKAAMFRSAPGWARFLAPVITGIYRLRRLWSGAYNLKTHTYRIFTMQSPGNRISFDVQNPTFRWPGR